MGKSRKNRSKNKKRSKRKQKGGDKVLQSETQVTDITQKYDIFINNEKKSLYITIDTNKITGLFEVDGNIYVRTYGISSGACYYKLNNFNLNGENLTYVGTISSESGTIALTTEKEAIKVDDDDTKTKLEKLNTVKDLGTTAKTAAVGFGFDAAAACLIC
jgi:hypothetical protein